MFNVHTVSTVYYLANLYLKQPRLFCGTWSRNNITTSRGCKSSV